MTPRARLTRTRAATTVEYALILIAVLLVAAGSWKLLGGKLGTRSGTAGDVVAGEGATRSGGGGSAKGGGAGGGGGAQTGGDKSNVTSKVSVGGVGGANGEQGGGSTRDTSSETNTGAGAGGKDSGGNADVTETFSPKRWMGIGLLAAGVLAMLYVVSSLRRTKKAADAAGPRDGPAPAQRKRQP